MREPHHAQLMGGPTRVALLAFCLEERPFAALRSVSGTALRCRGAGQGAVLGQLEALEAALELGEALLEMVAPYRYC